MNDIEFRTKVSPLRHNGMINHSGRLLMLGSCFSDNIGDRLRQGFFNVTVNPFGTLYNPASIAAALHRLADPRPFGSADLLFHAGRYHSFMHHSSFSSVVASQALDMMNRSLAEGADALRRCSVLIITLGTSWVYELCGSGRVVSNCHKLPADHFVRRFMPADESFRLLHDAIDEVRQLNPGVSVVFTVSPIRHLADGMHGNQLSKAMLLICCDRLCRESDCNIYFPSYEIMMDDLRDYRFYAADMKHPSEVAVEYIYAVFAQSFFDSATVGLADECQSLWRRISHRHMTDDQAARSRFDAVTRHKLELLLDTHPELGDAVNKIHIM